jgi:hypothetical protein
MQATPSTWQLLQNADWQNEEGIKILVGGEALKRTSKITSQKEEKHGTYMVLLKQRSGPR